MNKALPYFRLLATEFAGRDDDEVGIWLEMTQAMVSAEFFGEMYLQALALRAAHRMKLSMVAADEAEGVYPVKSIAEDGGSVSFAVKQASLKEGDGLLQTAYGQQYLEIMKGMYAPLVF